MCTDLWWSDLICTAGTHVHWCVIIWPWMNLCVLICTDANLFVLMCNAWNYKVMMCIDVFCLSLFGSDMYWRVICIELCWLVFMCTDCALMLDISCAVGKPSCGYRRPTYRTLLSNLMHKKFNLQNWLFNFCLTKIDLQHWLSNVSPVWVNLHKVNLRVLDARNNGHANFQKLMSNMKKLRTIRKR